MSHLDVYGIETTLKYSSYKCQKSINLIIPLIVLQTWYIFVSEFDRYIIISFFSRHIVHSTCAVVVILTGNLSFTRSCHKKRE